MNLRKSPSGTRHRARRHRRSARQAPGSRVPPRLVRDSESRVREVHAAERPAGHPARRPEAADRPREPVVPRRLEEREDRAHRLRAPLRAHDVPGLEERARSEYFAYAEKAGANLAGGGRQRHDEQRPHELLRDRALRKPGEPAVARVGPPGDAARRPDEGEARQPARRRQERAAAGAREHALRALVQAHHREHLSGRTPLLVDRHRQPGGPDRGDARRREGLLPHLLHAEQPLARHRRRLRSGGGEAARREVLRRHPGRPGPRSPARVDPGRSSGEKIVEATDRVPQERTT